MTNNLTLIESEVLDTLVEKAMAYDFYYDALVNLLFTENKEIEAKKDEFLSKYVTIPMEDPDGTIEKGLTKLGYK